MNKYKYFLFYFAIVLGINLSCAQNVLSGLDQIYGYQSLFAGKQIGVITNHTAYNDTGKHITDIFLDMKNVQLTALFGPEHGIRGEADAGEKIDSITDPLSGIPIFSLYGKTRKPTADMLKNIDLLVFDIQDIGSRFYTYIWTMSLAMEAAAENNIPFVVLDRPNPLNGLQVEGNILEPAFSTFVGMYPIPVRHGMTVGELARMFNGEGWLKNGIKANLTVIPIKNWQRNQWFDQTGLEFIKPSPNMPNMETATVYPGICLLEGTNVSEGRGTRSPFLLFGAPWIDGQVLADSLNALKLPGVQFKAESFKPKSMPGMSMHPKYKDRHCDGIRINISNRNYFKSYLTGIRIVETINKMYPNHFEWKIKHFDRLCGTTLIRESINSHSDTGFIINRFAKQEKEFKFARKPYLLYH